MIKYLCAAALLVASSAVFANNFEPKIPKSYNAPGVVFQSNMSLSDPSVAVLINNLVRMSNVPLIQFGNLAFSYSPTIRQVIAKNIGKSENYYISYTILGNTYKLGTLSYTSVPAASPNATPIIIKPGQTIYFTVDKKYNSDYDVATYNAKMIWQDMTVNDGSGNYFQCNKNNQHVTPLPKDKNRISLSCFPLSDS